MIFNAGTIDPALCFHSQTRSLAFLCYTSQSSTDPVFPLPFSFPFFDAYQASWFQNMFRGNQANVAGRLDPGTTILKNAKIA